MTDSGTHVLNDLYAALGEKYGDRSGVHVSDITLCPREKVFLKFEPQPIDNTQLGFFTSGEAIGIAIQALATSNSRYKAEYEIVYEGLIAHIDLYDEVFGIPIECKSFNGAKMDMPKPHYVTQLKAYMAMTNSHTGVILVQLLQHFRDPHGNGPFKTWVISLTDEQILAERARLIQEAANFKVALLLKDPSKARHVMDDKDLNWKCTHCKFVDRCREMNKAK